MSLLAFHIHLNTEFLLLEPLIIFSVIKTFFSSLTFTSLLPMVILANGFQTIAKGIGSACPLPSLPLYVCFSCSRFSFNLISISKLTHDLNFSVTFSNNSITL